MFFVIIFVLIYTQTYMNDLVLVKTFTTRLEAQIAKGALEAQKIKSLVTADDEGGASPYPMQPAATGVKLLVAVKDYKTALNFLNAAEK
jgi:hypothetical protein